MSEQAKANVIVSASLAHDFIMSFAGSFQDHILPDKLHVLSVSFLLDGLRRQRGGVAGNIAYSLALLGERPLLVGAVGPDFGEYREVFDALGIDMSLVFEHDEDLTAYAFMMADLHGNQIASFYPGASGHAEELPVGEAAKSLAYGIVGATAPTVMRRHSEAIAATGCRLFYDPSQQIVVLPADDLVAGIDAAWGIVLNDYELGMLEKKTGLGLDHLKERVPFVGVTFGEQGSELHHDGQVVRIPVAPAEPVVDPTGGGDAYRSGLLKALLLGVDLPVAGRMAALAATYAIERHGPQEHRYTANMFIERFDRTFPDFSGELRANQLRTEGVGIQDAMAPVA
ncbi:MAG TPA: carbohydrate kinase family protein [Thermomicrobiales bacterium]|nr:carbohydrate kinase family protein [Thermomicrobiales bacterium]